jgi:hypothetical protein
MAKLPVPSELFTSTLVSNRVSLSAAVMVNTFPSSSKRKQSKIGNEFFELITLLIACRWLNNVALDTTNFIGSEFI